MSARRNGSCRRTAAAVASSPMKTKMKSNAKVKSDVPDQLSALQEQLTRQLQQTIEDTVGAVCDDFQHDLKAALAAAAANNNNSSSSSTRNGAKQQQMSIPAVAQFGAASTADYEVYYSCCKRLVAYISANMATSPDFAPQMDRIILAYHSNAPERVLRSIATKNVWFHRRDGGVAPETASETDEVEVVERPTRAVAAAAKAAYGGSPVPKKSERLIKKEKESLARMTRTTARKSAEASLPPPRAPSKRRSPAAPAPEPPVAKRLRPAARRSLPLPKYDDEDEDEDEEQEEEEEEEEEAEVDADQGEDYDDEESATNQPHYETADELLDFKDPVRDMCYVDKRTPAQTKFFKERLRKAILFVDAQLCKPPPGKVCARDCKKIRAVMCDRNLPCRNKICRVWHDVEVHIDRCQNTHCELKNRIMLRETMHKIDHKKLQIHNAKLEVQAKKKQLDDIKNEESNEREQYIELTLLTNEIGELEGDIAAAEEELGILNGTKKAFWACLNVVGIELKDDVADGFPDLAMHYANKKQAAAKTRAPKRAAKDLESFVPEEEPQQDDEVGVNDDGGFGGAINTGGPMPPITRRTMRRSTTKTFQAMAQDAVSAESEEETKSAEDGEQGNGVGENAVVQEETVGESVGSDDGTAVTNIHVTGQSTASMFQNAQANGGDDTEDQFPETQDLNDLRELLPQTGTDSDHSVQNQQVSQIVITNQRAVQVTTSSSSSSSSSTTMINRSSATVVASASRELQPLPIPSNIQISSQPQPVTSLPLTVPTPASQQPLTGAPTNPSA